MLAHIDASRANTSMRRASASTRRRRRSSGATRRSRASRSQLARLKAWKFGAKTERMNAEQREIFEETLAEDQADLEAQLAALQAQLHRKPQRTRQAAAPPAQARGTAATPAARGAAHRARGHHCPTPECGRPMVRVGEDISERLDIVPAEFFVHRQIHGKWACKCCQLLVQEPAAAQIIDSGCHAGPAGPHADQPLRRSPSVLPAGADQRPLGRAHAALDAGGLERARPARS